MGPQDEGNKPEPKSTPLRDGGLGEEAHRQPAGMGLAGQHWICNTIKASRPGFVLRAAGCQPVPCGASSVRFIIEAAWISVFGDAETPNPDLERCVGIRRAIGVVRRSGLRREGAQST